MFRRYIQRDKGSQYPPPIRPFHDRIVALMPLRWYRGPMCDRMWFATPLPLCIYVFTAP